MNKEELLECLKSLSTTNNKRDGIDIKKEEAQLIIEIINKQKEVLDKIKEKLQNELDNYNVTMGRAEKIELLELLEEVNE